MASVFDRYTALIVTTNKNEVEKRLPFREALSKAGVESFIVNLGPLDCSYDHVISIFNYFLTQNRERKVVSSVNINLSERYQIDVCKNNFAYVTDKFDYDNCVGHINPNSVTECVESVYYMHRKSQKRLMLDYYDDFGQLYSRVIQSEENSKVLSQTYFDSDGKEVIYEDYCTCFIRLLFEGKYLYFANRGELSDWFFSHFKLYDKKLLFAEDHWTVRTVCEHSRETVRICSNIEDKNCDSRYNCKYFVFDNENCELSDTIYRLGKVYDFARRNTFSKNCIMHVNRSTSDKAYTLIESLPFLMFHVVIEDGDSVECLTKFCKLTNVKMYHMDLYLSFAGIMKNKLLKICDLAIDIDGYLKAFEEDMFLNDVLMFSLTGAASEYIYKSHIYTLEQTNQLRSLLLLGNASGSVLKSELDKQHTCVYCSDLSDYQRFAETVFKKYSYSIVIPAYNSEKTVKATLDSLFEQISSEDDAEVICVDDCSTDSTSEIFERYAKKHSCMRVIHLTERVSTGIVRNTGIDAASKKFVCFLDSDDFIHLDSVRKIIDCMKGVSDVGIGMCNNGGLRLSDGRYNTEDIYNILFQFAGPSACSKIWRLSFLKANNVRFNDNIFAEDMYFTYSALLHSRQLSLLHERVIDYTVPAVNPNKGRYRDVNIISELFKSLNMLYEILKLKKIELLSEDYAALLSSYQTLICEHIYYQRSSIDNKVRTETLELLGKLSFEIISEINDFKHC